MYNVSSKAQKVCQNIAVHGQKSFKCCLRSGMQNIFFQTGYFHTKRFIPTDSYNVSNISYDLQMSVMFLLADSRNVY